MYRAHDFTFAGIPASSFGMYVSDIGSKKHSDNAFGTVANIVEKRTSKRVKPLHYGVKYNDEPLKFNLIFGADRELDRYEMQEISKWLMGYQDYQWLSIDQPDMEHIRFRCLIKSLTPISVGWIPMAFEASVVCDCPYGYSYPFEKKFVVDGTNTLVDRFYNDSTVRERLRPQMRIEISPGCREFSVTNRTTGDVVQFKDLPSDGVTFIIDNENEVIEEEQGKYNPYAYFNFGFFSAESGDNALEFSGQGAVTISGMYLYNVGA